MRRLYSETARYLVVSWMCLGQPAEDIRSFILPRGTVWLIHSKTLLDCQYLASRITLETFLFSRH